MANRVASAYVNLSRQHKNGFKAAGISDALTELLILVVVVVVIINYVHRFC